MTIRQTLFTVLLTLLATSTHRAANAPMLLNYQGNLATPDGTPQDGTFSMQFAVYDAATGGTQLPTGTPWTETQNVVVVEGVFNVLLGSVTPIPQALFEDGPSDTAGPLRFLEISVDGETLAPRRRIASAAYAIATPSGGLRTAGGSVVNLASTTSGSVATGFRPQLVTVFLTNVQSGVAYSSFGSARDGVPPAQNSIFVSSSGNSGIGHTNVGFTSGGNLTISSFSDTGFAWLYDHGGSGTGNFHWVAYGVDP